MQIESSPRVVCRRSSKSAPWLSAIWPHSRREHQSVLDQACWSSFVPSSWRCRSKRALHDPRYPSCGDAPQTANQWCSPRDRLRRCLVPPVWDHRQIGDLSISPFPGRRDIGCTLVSPTWCLKLLCFGRRPGEFRCPWGKSQGQGTVQPGRAQDSLPQFLQCRLGA